MLIGELSRRTGFSHDTIRFYEKKGLIRIDRKSRRENNYKEYPESVYDKLILIRNIKSLGFTLNEIDEFVRAWADEGASCKTLTHRLTGKISHVDKQIKILEEVKSNLQKSLSHCQDNDCQFEKLGSR